MAQRALRRHADEEAQPKRAVRRVGRFCLSTAARLLTSQGVAAWDDARVREQQKRLKLVRESSTLFRRLASSGADIEAADGRGARCFFMTVRDPVARLQSQLERMSATPNHRLHAMMARPRVFNASETTSLMGTAAVDNYLTRLLLGPSAFFLPLRGINASHALAASRVLARFAADDGAAVA